MSGQDKTASQGERIAELEAALRLALEYWAHRQQRYKNRHPAWVIAAKAAMKVNDK